jgi:hypothetical protein
MSEAAFAFYIAVQHHKAQHYHYGSMHMGLCFSLFLSGCSEHSVIPNNLPYIIMRSTSHVITNPSFNVYLFIYFTVIQLFDVSPPPGASEEQNQEAVRWSRRKMQYIFLVFTCQYVPWATPTPRYFEV